MGFVDPNEPAIGKAREGARYPPDAVSTAYFWPTV